MTQKLHVILTEEEKKLHLKNFNHVYYESDDKQFKVNALPFWIDQYGYWLSKELDDALPKYYHSYRPGTVVMVDFGIKIGSEMSGPHFAVVLSAKDNQHKKTLIVVPLTSRNRKSYIELGTELQAGIIRTTKKLIDNNSKRIERFNNDSENLQKKVFALRDRLEQELKDKGITPVTTEPSSLDESQKKMEQMQKLLKGSENEELRAAAQKVIYYIKQVKYQEFYRKIILSHINASSALLKKAKKYGNNSYADVSNISTISKLRITSFSEQNISGNIFVTEKALKSIKKKLNNLI